MLVLKEVMAIATVLAIGACGYDGEAPGTSPSDSIVLEIERLEQEQEAVATAIEAYIAFENARWEAAVPNCPRLQQEIIRQVRAGTIQRDDPRVARRGECIGAEGWQRDTVWSRDWPSLLTRRDRAERDLQGIRRGGMTRNYANAKQRALQIGAAEGSGNAAAERLLLEQARQLSYEVVAWANTYDITCIEERTQDIQREVPCTRRGDLWGTAWAERWTPEE